MKIEPYANQEPLDPASIYTLPAIDKNDPDVVHLLQTIKKRKIPITHERKNTGVGRSTTFGIAFKKYQGHKYSYCVNNKKYPELYEAMLKVGKKICPIPFYAIQVNHNYEATAHIDKNNIGHSVILAIGDYTGGEFCVEGNELDISYKPIVVDATANVHWVNKVLSGNRYSFVFFTGKPMRHKDLGLLKPSDLGEL